MPSFQEKLDALFGEGEVTPAAPGPEAQSFNQRLDALFADTPMGEMPKVTTPAEPDWSLARQGLDAVLLGGGIPAAAGLASAVGGVPYAETKQGLEREKRAWEKANPGKALLTDLAGTMLPVGAALALGQGAISAPLAGRIAAAAPRLAPLTRFAMGEAGPLSQLHTGAAQGAIAAGMTAGMHPEPVGKQIAEGAMLGAASNPILRAVGQRIGSEVNPLMARNAERAIELGVPLRAGMIPGASPVMRGLQGVFGRRADTMGPWTEALSRTVTDRASGAPFAQPTRELTHDWVTGAQRTIGREMDTVAANTRIPANDPQFLARLNDIDSDAMAELGPALYPEFRQRVMDLIDRTVQQHMAPGRTGDIGGAVYQALTRHKGPLYQAGRNPNYGYLAHRVRDALDDALTRYAPGEAARLADARRSYKNSLILERWLDESTGEINPSKLYNTVRSERAPGYGGTARAGDLGTLAEVGQNILAQRGDANVASHVRSPSSWRNPMLASGAASAVGVPVGLELSHGMPHVIPYLTADNALTLGTLAGLTSAGGYAAHRVANSPALTNRLLLQAQGVIPKGRVNPAILPILDFYREREGAK